MGLDQFVYRIKNFKKFEEAKNEYKNYKKKVVKSNKTLIKKSYPIIKPHFQDIKLLLKKVNSNYNTNIELYLKDEDDELRLTSDLLYIIQLHLRNIKIIKKRIKFYLFNHFSMFSLAIGDQEELAKDKLTEGIIRIAIDKIIPDIPDNLQKYIIEFFNEIDEYHRLEEKYCSLKEEILYWSKANMIHGWFKKNVNFIDQDIESDYFDKKVLEKLYEDCKKVTKIFKKYSDKENFKLTENNEDFHKVTKLFSPTYGPFFGSTDVDKWYFLEIEITQKKLENLLPKFKNSDKFFYYAFY
jgi:hypothetical protein